MEYNLRVGYFLQTRELLSNFSRCMFFPLAKPEEITQEEKDDVHNTEKAISDEKAKRNDIISGYAKNNNIVHQLIDLALLQNGMLKGASLDAFLKRSVDMIK